MAAHWNAGFKTVSTMPCSSKNLYWASSQSLARRVTAYEPSKRRLVWPNGSIATIFTSEELDRLRGPQFHYAWLDEMASFRNITETWDMLMFGMRLGKNPKVLVSTTPRPLKILKQLIARRGQDVVITGGSTFDNRDNLAPGFLSTIVNRYAGTRLGRQELNAEILEEVEGALWTLDLIEENRVARNDTSPLKRIVVAIDPAVSVSEKSDVTGIVVAGINYGGHGYVLEDCSGKYSPTEWAQKAIAAYRSHKADRIVAESNRPRTEHHCAPVICFRRVFPVRGHDRRPIAARRRRRRKIEALLNVLGPRAEAAGRRSQAAGGIASSQAW
jgi:phage terminase large subunit-like protein